MVRHLLPELTALLAATALLLAPGPARAQQVKATPSPVTFVAYNLKNYLKMDRRVRGEKLEDAPKPENEIAALVGIIAATRPDILGVSEIGTREEVADLQNRLKTEGINLPHTEWVQAADHTRHLALLSRFPITARDSQTDLTYTIDLDTIPFQRGILDATVQTPDGYTLRLLGLHLKSKREIKWADQMLMRRNEAYLLRKHIDDILEATPTTNLLIYGDFNENRNESPIRSIQGKFGTERYLRDIQLADKNGSRWTYYWRTADVYSRFDFIFVSPGLYPEIIRNQSYIAASPDWYTASDHRPLVVKLTPQDRDTP